MGPGKARVRVSLAGLGQGMLNLLYKVNLAKLFQVRYRNLRGVIFLKIFNF